MNKLSEIEDRYNEVKARNYAEYTKSIMSEGSDKNSNVISISDNKYIKNRRDRLKQLDKYEGELKDILKETKKNLSKKNLSKKNKKVKITGSLLDKYSARELLQAVNPDLLNEIDSAYSDSDKRKNKKRGKIQGGKKAKDKAMLAKIKAREAREADKSLKSDNSNNQEKANRIKIDVNANNKEYEPIKLTVREDESSIHKISENNEKIYERLMDMGEVQMANHVHMLMERVKVGPKYKYASEIQDNTNALKAVSITNKGIEQHLKTLKEMMHSGQDTEIEDVESKLAENVIKEEEEKYIREDDPNLLTWLLDLIFGRAFGAIFRTAFRGVKSIFGLGVRLLTPMIGWILKSLSGGITTLFNNLFAKPLEAFRNLTTKVDDFIGKTFSAFKAGYDATIGILTKSIDFVTGIVDKVKTAVTGFVKAGFFAGVDKVKDISSAAISKAGDLIPDNVKNTASKIRNVFGAVKETVYKAGSGAIDWTKGKFAKISKAISETASKVGSKFGSIPQKLSNHVSTTGGKVANSSLMGKMGKFAKVLKAVPFLGTALAVGFAANAAKSGYENAGALYGVPQEEVSAPAKAASALGAVVEELLWPIPINPKTVAMAALNLTGQSIKPRGEKVQGDFTEGSLGDVSQFEKPPEKYVDDSGLGFEDAQYLDSVRLNNEKDEEKRQVIKDRMTARAEAKNNSETPAEAPSNNKEVHQGRIDDAIEKTKESIKSETNEDIVALSNAVNNLQQQVVKQQINISTETGNSDTTNIFSLENEEYNTNQELMY